MSPPIESWPARELPVRVLAKPDGRRKKDADEIDLGGCPLRELVQYACNAEQGPGGKQVIRCSQLVRTFRQCAGFVAETTALESLDRRMGSSGSDVSNVDV